MTRKLSVVLVLAMIGALVIVAAGCSGQSVEDEFKSEFKEQGMDVSKVNVVMNPHEAQIMMDKMILKSNGIEPNDGLHYIHATVTLDNGEEVSAVKYNGKIYTYKNQ